MSTMVFEHTPTRLKAKPATPGDTDPHFVGIVPSATGGAVTFHTTLAALRAAGKNSYPGLDAGCKIRKCLITSKTSAGADGSPIEYATDYTGTLPTDITGWQNIVDGSGQQISIDCPFRTLAIRCTVGSDYVILDGKY